jgi:opacity protein-like surface antigen
MRVLTIVGLALACAVASASAQHGNQIEFGGFGTYTRYDPVYALDQQFGGGGRLGFFLGEYFGLEVDANMATPIHQAGAFIGQGAPRLRGSASLLINSGGEHNILYVIGGYTRTRLGGYSPYGWLNQVHGGIGDRIFFGSRVALRLEARVYYAPGDQYSGAGKSPLDYSGSAGLSLFLFGHHGGGGREAPAIPKQTRDSIIAAGGTLPPQEAKPSRKVFVGSGANWQRQWFWGAQAGALIFKTDFDGISAEPTFGGHWLITAKRTAMYAAYEQSFFITDRHATIIEPNGTIEPGNVAFRGMRRLMMGVLAFPVQKAVQPYGGGGFAIMEILNPTTTCTGCTISSAALVQQAADNASTKAFFWWMAGIDVRQGRLGLYGHYILTSSARGFLINGVTHTVQGGIRYSFGSSREDVSETH